MVNTGGGKQGAAFRRGFSAQEMKNFATGKRIEWKDDRRWHPGTVVIGPRTDLTGAMYVLVRNTGAATRNVDAGEVTRAYPGSIRRA